jgi:hypothetical protein
MSQLIQNPEHNTIATTLEQIATGAVVALGGIALATEKAYEVSPIGFAVGLAIAAVGGLAAESGWAHRPR